MYDYSVGKDMSIRGRASTGAGEASPHQRYSGNSFTFHEWIFPSNLQEDTAEFALPSLALYLLCAFYRMNDAR